LLPSASRALFTLPRTALRTARFRTRRFSFCRIRFSAERVFAKGSLLLLGMGSGYGFWMRS
jgi:hypothetical protein